MNRIQSLRQLLQDTESAVKRLDELAIKNPTDAVITSNFIAIQKRKYDLERRIESVSVESDGDETAETAPPSRTLPERHGVAAGDSAQPKRFSPVFRAEPVGRSSEVLVGVGGGSFSLLLAYAASVALPGLSFALGGPIAACVGLPLSILVWRGRRRFLIERDAAENRLRIEAEIAANKLRADEVMERLKSLPKDAPDQLKEAFYNEYLALTADLRLHSLPQADELSAPMALPQP